RLSFCVAVKEEEAKEETKVDFSGWLLKKKRKRMQGWARRWFAVQGAWLVYSTAEGGVPRAKVDVTGAVVSASKDDRSITVDADEGFLQLRAQTQEEYEAWVAALKHAKEGALASNSLGTTLQQDQLLPRARTEAGAKTAAYLHSEFENAVQQLRGMLGDQELGILQAAIDSERALHCLATGGEAYSESMSASCASWVSEPDVFYDTNEVLELTESCEDNVGKPAEAAVENNINSSSSDDDDRSFTRGSDTSSRSSRLRKDLIRDPDFIEAMVRNSLQVSITENESDKKRAEAEAEVEEEASDANTDPQPTATIDSTRMQLVGYEPRTRLPVEKVPATISLISILRKNVGKDLSSIAMPLVINEPINALQALCEELVYQRLLLQASDKTDSLDRLMYVATFAISTLSTKKPRAERKPFNPLLGETYEMVDPALNFRFVAEKVSHHPPIMACYADAPAFRFWQDSSGKSKFWGKSMEIVQTSSVHVELLAHGDHFTWSKPSALVRGLLAGARSVEFTGEMVVTNHVTGDRCVIVLKEGGMFSSSTDEVECRLYRGGSNTCERVLRGCWSSHLRHERLPGQHPDTLWEVAALPPDADRYYGFSFYTMKLNELPDALRPVLPPTDTRLRPDQRAYEEGRVDEAEALKTELEEAQRARKRRRDENEVDWAPQWFELRDDPHSNEGRSWQYSGGYWAARARRAFPQTDQLW
ncbi:Oxysterol-binding protein 3, partial [Kickxella alabastrina]